ncbi:MAG: DUF1028 domain-containing protein [Pseudomonadota bacterium]|nr:DUF1028 domain-containing protein [Pseudomonadota bacterium]
MIWSLMARDADGRIGVTIASRFFAVGALCMHTRGGVGAVCTQALMNPQYGARGLAMLAAGTTAAVVVQRLTDADDGRDQRQLHMLPVRGAGAAYTGARCVDWCGHQMHPDFSVAGNMLAGEAVLAETAAAYRKAAESGLPLAERLLLALQAGDYAGGDKRGRQSAALRVQGPDSYPELDLRVDDHEQPFSELQRLYDKSLERFQPFVACLPRRGHPAGETDRAALEAQIAAWHLQRGG